MTKTEYVYVTPPPAYVQTYEMPELQGEKNRNLLIWGLDLKKVLRMHNEDKRALQDWMKAVDNKEDEE